MFRNFWRPWLSILVLAGVAAAAVTAANINLRSGRPARLVISSHVAASPVIDELFAKQWAEDAVAAASPANELSVLRRMSLALHGTVPSLEEIRAFERDSRPDRLRQRVRVMLADSRFADYFAERLARAWVGLGDGQFLVFRRDRFTRWLAEELRRNRPYDAIVREMISADGLWTSEPAVNFVSAAIANDDLDENVLAARTVRGFLGQRIDCAQCHDHPFAEWKQRQFEGLAAFYGQSAASLQGIVDQPRLFENVLELRIEEPATKEQRIVEPAVPFLSECVPAGTQRRDRLAAWVTAPQNERFTRAAVNRVWGLLFGRPFVEPVDDLPNPGDERTKLLTQVGDGFRESGYDLRWLIESIVLSRPFGAASALTDADLASFERSENAWAVFPTTRLRPEQVIGAMIQAGRLQTIDQNSHLFARTIRYFREIDFVKEYGDAGEAELDARSGTVSQALLRMNGDLTKELFGSGPASSAGRISSMADAAQVVELCFLVTLTRRPTADETAHFLPDVRDTKQEARGQAIEDLLWSLVNSAEFSWNH